MKRSTWRVGFRWTARIGLVLVVLGAAYLGWLFVREGRTVSLPAPTGRFPVGRALFTWTDASRTDSLSPVRPAGVRRLSVWLWFPAATGSSGRDRAPYLPGAWSGLHLPAPIGWAEPSFDEIDAHTEAKALLADGRFPVIVLLPGLGFAAPQYSSLAVELASHGFIVAGVTPTYSANFTVLDGRPTHASPLGNPRGLAEEHTPDSDRIALRLLQVWTADARFAAGQLAHLGSRDRFAGHIDASRVAYVGHSFGGTAALEACSHDGHCVAAVDIDGAELGAVTRLGLPHPLLLIGHDGSCVAALCAAATAADQADLSTARRLLSLSHGHAWSVSIERTKHFDFTDYAAYSLAFPLRALLPLGSIEGGRALRLTGDVLTRFLDNSFGRTAASLAAVQKDHAGLLIRAW